MRSACSGACAGAWPPVRADGKPTVGEGANASLVGTTTRSDGAPQVAYNGHPPYLYQGDQQPGDTSGQGLTMFGGGWRQWLLARASEMQIRLKQLQAERLLASSEGLAADTAYMADLDEEIAELSDAYVGAGVTEIATLPAELFGPQVG